MLVLESLGGGVQRLVLGQLDNAYLVAASGAGCTGAGGRIGITGGVI